MGSIWKTSEETKILDAVDKCLGPKGYRVVDLDVRLSGRSLVRVFIEKMVAEGQAAAEPGATIADCAEVSRALGPLLDAEGSLIPGAYDLEVSSPGLDRRLRLVSDFEKVVGSEVKVHLRQAIPGGGAKLTGTLLRVVAERIVVKSSGTEVEIPLENVKLAHRVWQFTPRN